MTRIHGPKRTVWLAMLVLTLFSAEKLRADDDVATALDEARAEVVIAVENASEEVHEAVKNAKQAVKEAAKEAAAAHHRYGIARSGAGTSPYWLNLSLAQVPKALDAQLDLKGDGLLVEHVGKDGAAAKAGIEVNDVLLAVGDKPLKKHSELEAALAEGKEISLKVLRGGKPLTIAVTPAKRELLGISGTINAREIERTVREKLKDAGVSDFTIDFVQPGTFAPHGMHVRSELPDDASVTIRKQGKKPAEIEVKQGDQTWNVKEDDLSPLPDELRKPVHALLGKGSVFNYKIAPHHGPGAQWVISPPVARPVTAKPAAPAKPPVAKVDGDQGDRRSLEKNVDELRDSLRDMRKELESLRNDLRQRGKSEEK